MNTLLDTLCFCQGFPRSVIDSIAHMHITGEQYAVQRVANDEIIVWVSHTDPLSYNNRLFSKRVPDYTVGRSMYEFSRIEEDGVKACNNDVDEVWVPFEFVRHAFLTSGVQPAKVYLIAEAIDVFAFDPAVATPITLPLRGRHTQH